MDKELRQTVSQLALPLIGEQGLILWGLDIVAGPTLKVCLYIDAPVTDGMAHAASATIDQCESISRQLGLALEVEDLIDQPWVLEVSSPGLERRFFSIDQMRPFIGDLAEARLCAPEDGRKTWRGRILAVGPDAFDLQPCAISDTGEVREEGAPVKISWSNVARARRLHVFTAPPKPGKGQPSKKKSAGK